MNKSENKFIKVFPWYSGLTADLLFYIVIDTLFMTMAKNFSAILINYPMIIVMALMLAISAVDTVLSIKLYKRLLIGTLKMPI